MSTLARILINASALACLCMAQPALSAEFRKSSLGASAPDLIEVVGELISGDAAKFIEVAIKSADAIVVFHSGGGDLLAGIEIGKAGGFPFAVDFLQVGIKHRENLPRSGAMAGYCAGFIRTRSITVEAPGFGASTSLVTK